MHTDRNDPSTANIELDVDQLDDLDEYLKEKFISRAQAQGFGKPTSAKYRDAEINFYAGAMSALVAIGVKHNQAMQPSWVFAALRGDSITVPPAKRGRKKKAAEG